LNATTTVKYFAKDTAGNSSAVQTVAYTLNATPPADTTAPTVTASPVGGTFTSSQNVTLSANETATIYYTVDGTTPTYPVSGTTQTYSGPIALAATTTLKFIGRDTAGNVSTVQTQTYTINIPASLATIVSDSFNRADSATTLGNAETGQTWSYSNSVSNPWGISSNQAYLVSGTNAFAFVDSGKADVEISATFPVSPTSSTVHNIIARYTDTNNHYMFQNNGSNILFYKRVSGTYTQLGTVANTPQANDVMKVSLIGSTITLFINGVQKAQWTDSTYTTQTKHGLQAGTNACRFDDFKIAG
jgi:hypothetical protein